MAEARSSLSMGAGQTPPSSYAPTGSAPAKASGLKDNGTRTTFETGAVREERIVEKGRYDLIPGYPLHRLAVHYARGAVKYAPNNWMKGIPLSSFLDSAERHLNAFKMGDRSEDHMAAVAWNVFGFMWTANEIEASRLPSTLDDGHYLPSPYYCDTDSVISASERVVEGKLIPPAVPGPRPFGGTVRIVASSDGEDTRRTTRFMEAGAGMTVGAMLAALAVVQPTKTPYRAWYKVGSEPHEALPAEPLLHYQGSTLLVWSEGREQDRQSYFGRSVG